MSTNPIIVSPAYGRDYPSKTKALQDWQEGKDFILQDFMSPWYGKPCSIKDFSAGTTVHVRYNRMRSVVVTTI